MILALVFKFANTVACGIQIHQHTRTEMQDQMLGTNYPISLTRKVSKKKHQRLIQFQFFLSDMLPCFRDIFLNLFYMMNLVSLTNSSVF